MGPRIAGNNNPYYTAKEVVEILTKARELKVVSIKLEGFEAAFAPLIDGEDKNNIEEPPNNNENSCDVCGSELTRSFYGRKPYCRTCYLKRKENKWRQTGRW
jgi:hypothetical protein